MNRRAAPDAVLRAAWEAALAAVDAEACTAPHIPPAPPGRSVLIAVGKAAAAMALAAARVRRFDAGLVITRDGHGLPLPEPLRLIEAGHPLPDERGLDAAGQALELASELRAGDQLLALISGGGSALLTLPPPGISLRQKRDLTGRLLASGARIADINRVRAHLSLIKGGRLGEAAFPAEVVTLVISDVPGDDPSLVASGPTCQLCEEGDEPAAILPRFGLQTEPAISAWLQDPRSRPPPGPFGSTIVVARAADALAAAAAAVARSGWTAELLGDDLEGEAKELGAHHAELALAYPAETVLLSGGETSVSLGPVRGRGGRNLEYLLALGLAVEGKRPIHALAADTDGIDGTQPCAGAWLEPDTLARARQAGVDPLLALAEHRSHDVFAAADALLVTGPTRTNVNDFRGVAVADQARVR